MQIFNTKSENRTEQDVKDVNWLKHWIYYLSGVLIGRNCQSLAQSQLNLAQAQTNAL